VIDFEVDTSQQFADLAPEEEKRFFRVGRTGVRTAGNRLLKAIRRNAPRGESKQLAKAFVTRVRLQKKNGIIEARVQPRGPMRASRRDPKRHLQSWQWLKTYWLEFGTKFIAPRGFIRRSQMEQQAAIDDDLDAVARGD
jgi:hypothetical protein